MSLDAPSAPLVGSGLLRKPLRVRNNEPNMTVFTKTVAGDALRLSLAPSGQPGDTVRFPLALAEDIDFLNALDQGVISVVDGPPEVVAALQTNTEEIRAERQEDERRRIGLTMDRSQDNDMIGMSCIGPAGGNRQGKCGRPLIQKAAQTGKVPPLCTTHEHMAPLFSLREVGSRGDAETGASQSTAGIVRQEWRQATFGDQLPDEQV